jgi:hypothetical protein
VPPLRSILHTDGKFDPCNFDAKSGVRMIDLRSSSAFPVRARRGAARMRNSRVVNAQEDMRMKRTLAVLATAGAVAAAAVTAPAPAQAHGIGPGLAFGLVAGALAAGALAEPYYYGPGYGYYGPRYTYYYGPGYYGPGPYAYYGGPYIYRHRHWHHHW